MTTVQVRGRVRPSTPGGGRTRYLWEVRADGRLLARGSADTVSDAADAAAFHVRAARG